MFDIFQHNASYMLNKKIHRKNLTKKQMAFIETISKKYLSEYRNSSGILVIADPDTSLWFYAMSWIYPRVEVNGTDTIWVNGIVDYEAWKEQRTNPYLVLLDTKQTEEWVAKNSIDFGEYDEVYRVGKNVLLKAR